MRRENRLIRKKALVLSCLTLFACITTTLAADKPAKTPWKMTFDKINFNVKGYDGWRVGDPPQVALTVRDGVLSMREVGNRGYGVALRYVDYNIEKAPYLQVLFLDGKGKVSVGNASTGGGYFIDSIQGPGLFSVDLQQTSLKEGRKHGKFALSFMNFGPNGSNPGPETKIKLIQMTNKPADQIVVTLTDKQKKDKPGNGFLSVGDILELVLDTSSQYEGITFKFIDTKTGDPIKVNGKTTFPAVCDADRLGVAWSLKLKIDHKSDPKFKTWRIVKGQLRSGNSRVLVVAETKGGKYARIMTPLSYGVDFTPQTGGAPGGVASGKNLKQLLEGKVMLKSDFDDPKKSRWKIVAGDEWSFLRGRFGDLSDSKGPGGFGNWAIAGEPWWVDYKVSADMCEELDGAGSVFLAVRFQDPRNYYALEWKTAGRTDILQLIRCKDGSRYVIAKSENHKLDKFPFNLAVSISGDFLTGYLNGQPVVNGMVGDFNSGPAALGEIGRKVLMDNVKITRIVSSGQRSSFHRDLSFKYALKPRCFLRGQGKIKLPFVLKNSGKKAFKKVIVSLSFQEYDENPNAPAPEPPLVPSLEKVVDSIPPGGSVVIEFPLDTHILKKGIYMLRTKVALPRMGLKRDEVLYFAIARDWNPKRFNYFDWGLQKKKEDIEDYADHGFTMGIAGGRGTPLDWKFKGLPVPESAKPKQRKSGGSKALFSQMDLALMNGIIQGTNLISFIGKHFPPEVYGKDAKGKPTKLMLPYAPSFHEFSVNFATTRVKELGGYPGYLLMDINSETENHNQPDFSKLGLERAQKGFGASPPKQCSNMYGFPYTSVKGFAENGIVPNDNECLRFYTWFWLKGEGWNLLAADMAKAIRKIKPDMVLFHDPADRMPFFRDRNVGLNVWDWTYTTPNALTLPYKLEVLRAMHPKKYDKICNYVQILWKKYVIGDKDLCPSAAMIRLGLLLSASRPVYTVGHWNTNWMRTYANRDRWEGVKEIMDSFCKPLGPVLNSIKKDMPREVAFMLSHTNELFCAKFRGKWRKETLYAAWHEAFLRAGLPVDIVFEEDVIEGKLSKYKYLFLPVCEVTSQAAHDKIVEFSKNGGIVVADHNLGFKVPGVKIMKTSMDHMMYPNWAWMGRKNPSAVNAKQRIEKMWATTDEIREIFAPAIAKLPQADSKWLVVNGRLWNATRYVYAVNDKRSAGAVGRKYGTVLENGEELTASITVPNAANIAAVYDLTAHKEVAISRKGDSITWAKTYAPASAALFALLPRKIEKLELTTSKSVKLGGKFDINLKILDAKGAPIEGVVPIRMTLRDSRGEISEYTDYFAVENGEWSKSGWIAKNDSIGTWHVKIDDLASGKTVTTSFQVDK